MTLLICLVNFSAALLQSSIGFGYAMFGMTALSLLMPITSAGTIISFGLVCIGLHMTLTLHREIEWRVVLPVIGICLVSTTLGGYLLNHLEESLLRLTLAAVIFAFSLFFLYTQKKMVSVPGDVRLGLLFGFLAGLGTGLFSMAGPFFMIYYYSVSKSSLSYKANMEISFLCSGLFNLLLRLLGGNIDRSVYPIVLVSLPLIFCANLLGLHFYKKLPRNILKTIICLLLPVMALWVLLGK